MDAENKLSPDTENYRRRIKDRLLELYFVQTKSYLIMQRDGNYISYTKGKENSKGKKAKALHDWQLYAHLDGKHTLGARSGVMMNIFLAFDVDFPNISMAKWVTYAISNVLDEMRIEHHISFSGSKGYHIEIFFEDLVTHHIHKNLFDYVLDKADVRQYFKSKKSKMTRKNANGEDVELGEVEYRPSEAYGIKLPLGYHQKTKRFCGFCDKSDGLRVMGATESYEYLLKIKRINSKELTEEYFPELLTYTKIEQYASKEEFMQTESAIAQYNPLKQYNLNENEAIDEAQDLLTNGLKYKNSRHNSMFKIAKLFKYYGLEEDEATEKLLEWMNRQPKELYEATAEEARNDIIKSVHDVYAGSYSIKPIPKEIAVTYQEIVAIIKSCPKETEKLLMYAILIHSKRWATKQGAFYFTQEKMAEATALGLTTVKVTIPKLEKLGVLEYIKRNQKFDRETKKCPANEYRVTLKVDPEIVESKIYITDKQDDFNKCLLNFFTVDELKKKLPRRHVDKLKEIDIV